MGTPGAATWPTPPASHITAEKRDTARIWFGVGLVLVTLIGAIIRLWQLHERGLRNDESFSLLYASQSWSDVLGLHGYYDFHPPGSFTLAKLAGLFVDTIDASRTVSAIAGFLSLPVLYLLGVRLFERRTALVATALFAIHPVAVEYARIGRMYATVTLCVLISYVALVSFRDAPQKRWAALYGTSVLAAMYIDYSAIYALVPQLIPLAMIVRERWSESGRLLVALVLAVIGYLPWLPQLLDTANQAELYTPRNRYLGASWGRLGPTLDGVAGFTNLPFPTHWWDATWEQWPLLRTVYALSVFLLCLVGLTLISHLRLPTVVILAMVVGTPLTAFAFSQRSPGWDIRTLTPAVPGICLLLAVLVSPLAQARRLLPFGGVACLIVAILWTTALPRTYTDRDRQLRYDELTIALIGLNQQHLPILTYSTGGLDTAVLRAYADSALDESAILTFVDGRLEVTAAMARFLDDHPTRFDVRNEGIAPFFDPATHPAFWFVTYRPHDEFTEAFTEAGYQRLVQASFGKAMLELWAMPAAQIGTPAPMVGNWVSTADRSLQTALDIGPGLAIAQLPTVGLLQAEIKCLAARGNVLAHAELPPGTMPATEETIPIGVFCPSGTTRVRVLAHYRDGRGPAATFFMLPISDPPD